MKTLKEALASIKEVRDVRAGVPRVRFICELGTFGGKRQRIIRGRHDLCAAGVRDYYKTVGRTNGLGFALSAQQVSDACAALALLKQHGKAECLAVVANEWLALKAQEARSKLVKVTADAALAAYLKRFDDRQDATLAIAERHILGWMRSACAANGLLDDYFSVASVRAYVATFRTAATRNIALGRLKTFARWCAKPCNRYLAPEKAEAVCSLDKEAVPRRAVEVAEVRAVKLLFNHMIQSGSGSGYFLRAVLGFFCGCRTSEIERMAGHPECYRAKDGVLFVKRAKGYMVRDADRSFVVNGTARAWLDWIEARCVGGLDAAWKAMPTASQWEKRLAKVEERYGVRFPHNAARHSFISYDVALRENIGNTATVAGTSVAMIERHYKRVVAHDEAVAYFAVTP